MLLRVLDFETSGLKPPEAAICQIGMTDVLLEDGKITISPPFAIFINPGHPMPPEVRAVHHISDKNVADAPTPEDGLKLLMGTPHRPPKVFVAHHAEYDRQFFGGDGVPWICTRKVAMRVWPEAPNHKNQTLRYWLGVDEDAGFEPWNAMPPHRAGPDTYVTAHVLARAILKATIEDMIGWTNEPSLLPGAIHFGKHKGTAWGQVDPSYLEWIVSKAAEMDSDVLFTARHWLQRRRVDGR